MKAGWEEKLLGEVFEIGSSKRVVQRQWKSEGVPFYRAREIVILARQGFVENDLFIAEEHYAELKQKHGAPSPGDLMVSAVGTLGACYIVQPDDRFYFKDASVLRFQPLQDVSSEFFRYAFQWDGVLATVKKSEGATVGTLTISRAKSIPIPLPPLEEQLRIVAVLDEAFEGLARARAHAEANLKNAQELFVQELTQIFSSKKHGWKKGTIEELCTIRSGTTVPKSQEKPSGDVPYVKVADMNLIENTGGVLTSSRFLQMADVSDRKIIPAGATIFPKRGGAIMTNKKRKVLKDICADLNVMAVIPGEEIGEDFLHFFFLSLDMRGIGSGSAIPQINNYDIYPLNLSYPPDLHEQAQVAETLQIFRDRTIDLAEGYEFKIQDIDDLRQSLLQKAFAGELT